MTHPTTEVSNTLPFDVIVNDVPAVLAVTSTDVHGVPATV